MSIDAKIGARLADYAWTDAVDDLLAAELGCLPEDVAGVRRERELRRASLDLAAIVDSEAIARRADRLARQIGWTGSRVALLVTVLDGALMRTGRRADA